MANYRETVLTSFQEVGDTLAALRILEQESHVQDGAVKAAQVPTPEDINAGSRLF